MFHHSHMVFRYHVQIFRSKRLCQTDDDVQADVQQAAAAGRFRAFWMEIAVGISISNFW